MVKLKHGKMFQSFWNTQLDMITKERTGLYKKAKKSGREEDIARLKDFKKEMRKAVYKCKKVQYHEFVYSLDALPAGTAVSQVLRMATAIRRREHRNDRNVMEREPEVFTAHIANVCSVSSPWNWRPKPMHIPRDFENNIKAALAKTPQGKATRPDHIKS